MEDLRSQIEWQEPLPESARVGYYPLLRPRPGERVRCLVLSESVCQVRTHYYRSSTWPCTRKGGKCTGCASVANWRWEAYLAGLDLTYRKRVIVPITLNAVRSCPALLPAASGSLRGLRLTLERQAGKINGRVWAALDQPEGLHNLLSPAFDLEAALCCMWGYNFCELELKAAPPPF